MRSAAEAVGHFFRLSASRRLFLLAPPKATLFDLALPLTNDSSELASADTQ